MSEHDLAATRAAPAGEQRGDWVPIVEATTRMAWLVDRREWTQLAAVFADRVTLDYTSLLGGTPVTLSSAEVIAGWRTTLGGLDATQHLIGNHLVHVDGDRAQVTAQLLATHLLANPHGDPTWTIGGHYWFGLVRTGTTWLIDAVTMTATWATGNQQIMTLAAPPAP